MYSQEKTMVGGASLYYISYFLLFYHIRLDISTEEDINLFVAIVTHIVQNSP